MFPAEASGKLARPGVFREARLLWQRNQRRQIGVRATLARRRRANKWPIGRQRFAVVEQPAKARIGSMSGEVVVIAGRMVAGAAVIVSQQINQRQVMRLSRQLRQMFAQTQAGGRGGDRLEFAA